MDRRGFLGWLVAAIVALRVGRLPDAPPAPLEFNGLAVSPQELPRPRFPFTEISWVAYEA